MLSQSLANQDFFQVGIYHVLWSFASIVDDFEADPMRV